VSEIAKASRIGRREFLLNTGIFAGGIVAGTTLVGVAGGMRRDAGGTPEPTSRTQLYIPPTVSPSELALTETSATVDLGAGHMSAAWVYNGLMPGPTIRASRGEAARIRLTNRLPQETITHWHGMIVDDRNDGHPRYAIPPGGTYDYTFTIDQRAAMNWYHPHPHMLTGEQVALGLAGAFIVTDATEASLGLPSGAYEIPLVIRDASFDRTGNLEYVPRSGGFFGNTPLVNGTLNPELQVVTGRYRFRVLNGANARIFGLELGSGAPFTLIGNDGGLLESPVSLSRIELGPGERVDLIADFGGLQPDDRVTLRDARSGWNLLDFVVTRSVTDWGAVPASLSTIPPLSEPLRTRDFQFDGMSRINGLEYEVDRIDFQVPLGQTERWRFSTKGNAPHPVHVHGASFQVESRTGGRGRVFPWEGGWKDTVLLEDGETVDVLIRFESWKGTYLLHCHKLEHEDMGMMSNFEVL
jgi:FtsP/CotA-like multicopper oxidase with cupredoxin domain